ncbi:MULTISPECIES: hypothetical protein [unclassified Bradyrhizobium]|uniref:hypothetical protein n=1 Tax=unclassified Bradyrhizobium TaxID=2631580 RepID=UPI0023AF716A|nr:hypothetical protein [Bradyrhizobium sp. CSS354]MDE5461537.1 hypothetical protein [Bradyrhizobium sp. CSS354]
MAGKYESERRERLAERRTSNVDSDDPLPLESRFGPNSFGCHEALHVTNLVLGLIECELAEHPAILLQPEWYAHVRKVQDELYVLYPEIAVTQS